jgi:hypothetical protein
MAYLSTIVGGRIKRRWVNPSDPAAWAVDDHIWFDRFIVPKHARNFCQVARFVDVPQDSRL